MIMHPVPGKSRLVVLGLAAIFAIYLGGCTRKKVVTDTAGAESVLEGADPSTEGDSERPKRSRIAISPESTSVPVGLKQRFLAQDFLPGGISRDLDQVVRWEISDPGVAAIDDAGLLTALEPGNVTVTAYGSSGASAMASLTVTADEPVRIEILPPDARLPKRAMTQLSAFGIYADGSRRELTGVSWSSDASSVEVSASGDVTTGDDGGTATVTAMFRRATGLTLVSVTDATLTSVGITPDDVLLEPGESRALTLYGTFDDLTSHRLVGSGAVWSSSDPQLANIDASGRVTALESNERKTVEISVSYDVETASVPVVIAPREARLTGLTITPSASRVSLNADIQLRAMGAYSDGSTRDVTELVAWASEPREILRFSDDEPGLAVPASTTGQANITASLDGIEGGTTLLVTNATLVGIEITPPAPLPAGVTAPLVARGRFSDDSSIDMSSQLTWQSENGNVAQFGDRSRRELVRAIAPGTTAVTAKRGGITSAPVPLTVTSAALTGLSVVPSFTSLPTDALVQFRLIGHYGNGSIQDLTSSAAWTSSATDTMSIGTQSGLATSTRSGRATITASYGGQARQALVEVTTDTLVGTEIGPMLGELAVGTTQQFHLVGIYSNGLRRLLVGATWGSSDPSVLTVLPPGEAMALGTGQVTLTASYGSLSPASATLDVVAATPGTGTPGSGSSVVATPTPDYGFDPGQGGGEAAEACGPTGCVPCGGMPDPEGTPLPVATPTILGEATPLPGPVVHRINLRPEDLTLAVGESFRASVIAFDVEGNEIGDVTDQATIRVADRTIARARSPQGWTSWLWAWWTPAGHVEALRRGETTIHAELGNHAASMTLRVTGAVLHSIRVEPRELTLAAGLSRALRAMAVYSDGTEFDVTGIAVFTSSDPSSATFELSPGEPAGLLKAMAPAEALTITASHGGRSRTALVRVTGATLRAIAVTPSDPQLPLGLTQQLTATGTYYDGEELDLTGLVTWTLIAPGAVAISANGLVSAMSPGTSRIEARLGGVVGNTIVLVGGAPLSSLALDPPSVSLTAGEYRTISATGTDEAGARFDLSGQAVLWTSSNEAIARVDQRGRIEAFAPGAATIRAALGNQSATCAVTVRRLVSLRAEPRELFLSMQPGGRSGRISVTATYQDGGTQDVTQLMAWTSMSPEIASPIGESGVVLASALGTTQLTASLQGVTVGLTVQVLDAMLDRIVVAPAVAELHAGESLAYTATGWFTGETVSFARDLTRRVSWSTDSGTLVSVDPSGRVTGLAQGLATVTATHGSKSGSAVLRINPPVLRRIVVSPESSSMPQAAVWQLVASGFDTQWAEIPLQGVTWTSLTPALATVSGTGLVTSLGAEGDVLIQATSGDLSGFATIRVTAQQLRSLSASPSQVSLPQGGISEALTLLGSYDDTFDEDLTSAASWSSSDPAVATVERGIVTSVGPGTCTVTARWAGRTASVAITVTPALLTRILVTPRDPFLVLDEEPRRQLFAEGFFSDGTSRRLTHGVVWSSTQVGSGSIVSLETAPSPGLVTGLAPGDATVTATFGAISGSLPLKVVGERPFLEQIVVSPAESSLPAGRTLRFTATGRFYGNLVLDLSPFVTWSSNEESIATIESVPGNPEHGLLTAIRRGEEPIVVTATWHEGADFGTARLTVTEPEIVSVAISPQAPTIPVGATRQLALVETRSDGTTRNVSPVTWSSSRSGNASVNPTTGLVLGRVATTTATTVTITAVSGGITRTTPVTVIPPQIVSITVTPPSVSLAAGRTQQFRATALFTAGGSRALTAAEVSWETDNGCATVTPAGLAKAQAAGTARITARSRGVHGVVSVSGSASVTATPKALDAITVSPAAPSVVAGLTQQFIATGRYSDDSTENLSDSVLWTSSVDAWATIAEGGLATAIAAGAPTIKAASGTISGTAAFKVLPAALVSIAVTPAAPSLALGDSQQLVATGTYTDGTTKNLTASAAWTSASANVATVGNTVATKGLAKTLGEGTSDITAKLGTISGVTRLTVARRQLRSIAVAPAAHTLVKGQSKQLSATATYSNRTEIVTGTATWRSADESIASVSAAGLVTAVSPGTVDIEAAIGGTHGITRITVIPVRLESIHVRVYGTNLSALSVAKGVPMPFQAIGTRNDGTTDSNPAVTWSSSNTTVASVDSSGNASTLGTGSARIQAQAEGITGYATLTVTAPVLTSIAVTAPNDSRPKGTTVQYTATGTYTDGTTADITSSVTWASSSTATATISNAAATRGLAKAASPGTTTITAAKSGCTATCAGSGKSLTVTNPALTGITLAAASSSMPLGKPYRITPTGQFSDGTTADLSGRVTYSITSTGPGWGTMTQGGSPAAPVDEFIGTSLGSVNLTASYVDSFSGTVTSPARPIQITPAVVIALYVYPATGPAEVAKGEALPLVATAAYTDGAVRIITREALWSASPACVSVAAGLARGLTVGSCTVTAKLSGITGSAIVTVTPAPVTGIAIVPATATIEKNGTITLSIVHTRADGTSSPAGGATWSSLAPGIATIGSTNGVATGVGVGQATIRAVANGFSATLSLVVTPARIASIAISRAGSGVVWTGRSETFTAIATRTDGTTSDITADAACTWSSSAPAVATMSGNVAVAGSAGQTSITVLCSGIRSNAIALTVKRPALTTIYVIGPPQWAQSEWEIPLNATIQFTAWGQYEDLRTEVLPVTWSSSATAVSISSSGLATGRTAGANATITARHAASGRTGTTIVRVKPNVTSVTISPSAASIAVGEGQSFTATARYSNNTTADVTQSANWSTSHPGIASFSSPGLFRGVTAGVASIGVVFEGRAANVALTVTPARSLTGVTISPAGATILVGASHQFRAIASYSDSSSQDVTATAAWSTSNSAVGNFASSSPGNVVGIAPGVTSIGASYQGVAAIATLTVNAAGGTLERIAIEPGSAAIRIDESLNFSLRGYYDDGSSALITTGVTWSTRSSDPSGLPALTVDANGRVTAIGAAMKGAAVRASVPGMTAVEAAVTVLPRATASAQ